MADQFNDLIQIISALEKFKGEGTDALDLLNKLVDTIEELKKHNQDIGSLENLLNFGQENNALGKDMIDKINSIIDGMNKLSEKFKISKDLIEQLKNSFRSYIENFKDQSAIDTFRSSLQDVIHQIRLFGISLSTISVNDIRKFLRETKNVENILSTLGGITQKSAKDFVDSFKKAIVGSKEFKDSLNKVAIGAEGFREAIKSLPIDEQKQLLSIYNKFPPILQLLGIGAKKGTANLYDLGRVAREAGIKSLGPISNLSDKLNDLQRIKVAESLKGDSEKLAAALGYTGDEAEKVSKKIEELANKYEKATTKTTRFIRSLKSASTAAKGMASQSASFLGQIGLGPLGQIISAISSGSLLAILGTTFAAIMRQEQYVLTQFRTGMINAALPMAPTIGGPAVPTMEGLMNVRTGKASPEGIFESFYKMGNDFWRKFGDRFYQEIWPQLSQSLGNILPTGKDIGVDQLKSISNAFIGIARSAGISFQEMGNFMKGLALKFNVPIERLSEFSEKTFGAIHAIAEAKELPLPIVSRQFLQLAEITGRLGLGLEYTTKMTGAFTKLLSEGAISIQELGQFIEQFTRPNKQLLSKILLMHALGTAPPEIEGAFAGGGLNLVQLNREMVKMMSTPGGMERMQSAAMGSLGQLGRGLFPGAGVSPTEMSQIFSMMGVGAPFTMGVPAVPFARQPEAEKAFAQVQAQLPGLGKLNETARTAGIKMEDLGISFEQLKTRADELNIKLRDILSGMGAKFETLTKGMDSLTLAMKALVAVVAGSILLKGLGGLFNGLRKLVALTSEAGGISGIVKAASSTIASPAFIGSIIPIIVAAVGAYFAGKAFAGWRRKVGTERESRAIEKDWEEFRSIPQTEMKEMIEEAKQKGVLPEQIIKEHGYNPEGERSKKGTIEKISDFFGKVKHWFFPEKRQFAGRIPVEGLVQLHPGEEVISSSMMKTFEQVISSAQLGRDVGSQEVKKEMSETSNNISIHIEQILVNSGEGEKIGSDQDPLQSDIAQAIGEELRKMHQIRTSSG